MSNMQMGIGMVFGHRVNDGGLMMQGLRLPLNRTEANAEDVVEKVSGKDETKKHLADLGFVAGEKVKVTSARNGNIIVNVKGVKIAIGDDLAKRITVRG